MTISVLRQHFFGGVNVSLLLYPEFVQAQVENGYFYFLSQVVTDFYEHSFTLYFLMTQCVFTMTRILRCDPLEATFPELMKTVFQKNK